MSVPAEQFPDESARIRRCIEPRRLNIKGPSLQHDLKVLRVWKCPACGRSVRAEGSVTSRICECDEQARMEFSDAEPLPPADVSQFVSYMTPEFQTEDDDGADLPLPDLSTLVLPAPEPTGRRARQGTPLRDSQVEKPPESEPPGTEPPKTDVQEFGDGLEITPASTADTRPQKQPQIADVEESSQDTDDNAPAKRRPRRKRRRGRRPGPSSESQTVSPGELPPSESSELDTSPRQSATSGSTDQSSEPGGETAGPKKRRRRRRRTPRKNSSTDTGSGDSGSPPSGGNKE